MSLTLSLWRRATAEEPTLDDVEERPPIADAPYQVASTIAAKAATVLLWCCLVLSPVGAAAGVLALAQDGTAPVEVAPVRDQSNDRAIVGEFAQRVVLSWLTATQDHPDPLLELLTDVPASALSRDPFTAQDPTVAAIAETDGTWSVTVAVTVTDAREVTARRFFQVPVHLADGTVSALTLPAAVSPPPVVATASREYGALLGASSAPGETVSQFLTAYLTGAGNVSRYLTPGTTLVALVPAPYTTVRLVDLRGDTDLEPTITPVDGQRMRVLATATAQVTDTQSATVTYALTLTARAGRWEITAIDPTPAFTPQAPADQPAGTAPTPTGAGATTQPGPTPTPTTP